MSGADCVVMDRRDYDELLERNSMLTDIALSAVALTLCAENDLPLSFNALNRDLSAFKARFGTYARRFGARRDQRTQ